MSYVLDTNIVVAALNAHRDVVERLNSVPPDEAILPAMALAELRYGALSSGRVAETPSISRAVAAISRSVGGESDVSRPDSGGRIAVPDAPKFFFL